MSSRVNYVCISVLFQLALLLTFPEKYYVYQLIKNETSNLAQINTSVSGTMAINSLHASVLDQRSDMKCPMSFFNGIKLTAIYLV